MKKVLLIASMLCVAVASTACINNLAVQDLNNKAQSYVEQGDYTQAIERLKSSLDLDSSIFETHYNLAVAYTKAEDYVNAVDEYKKALKIKSTVPDLYFSLATAENNLAVDLEQGRVRMNDDGSLYTPKADDIDFSQDYKLSDNAKQFVNELFDSAIQNYQKYLELNPDSKDKDSVESQIKVISEHMSQQQEQMAE